MKLVLALVIAVALAACSDAASPAAPAAPAPDNPATRGSLAGTVRLQGTPPAPEMIRLDGDPKCVALAGSDRRANEVVATGPDGGLQNVFVYVKEGLPARIYPVPETPVVLDQQNCRYVPRVLGIQVGQPLLIKNSDPLLHNVRAEASVNQTFDVGTPLQGMEVTRTFATREVMVPFKCNVHAWMHAHIGVLEHPFFAVTDAEGRFSIPNLPAGTYTVETWHERYGTRTAQVTVEAQESAQLAVAYEAS